MKREYSSDFKRRVAVAVKTGASAQIVAARLKISVAEVQKWARQHEVDPKKLTRSQREENEIVSALLQHSTNKRYPSDFRGRVAVVVRSGVSARAVASRLGLSVETVQKWAEEYASERKKLSGAQAENELASLHIGLASMERQIQERLLEAFFAPSGRGGASSSSGGPLFRIAVPHPVQAQGPVTPYQAVINFSTSPFYAPYQFPFYARATIWNVPLTILVVDRSGNAVGPEFDGTPILEDQGAGWVPINQTLSGGSYIDNVGVMLFDNGLVLPVNPHSILREPHDLTIWLAAPPPKNLGPNGAIVQNPQYIRVRMGEFELAADWKDSGPTFPAIQGRQITGTLPNDIQVAWPDTPPAH